ncbi:MAG TPA: SDR family oxidoreductase [Actinomycetaceae bacterium]|nr:SDR family oxidoreductase [Actinomycetaceae bacterium]
MRTVLVTGGTRGIGYAIAESFRETGDDVVITGRHEGPLAEAAERLGARPLRADAEDPEQLARLVDAFPDGVDVVVNNAGGFAGTAPGPGADAAVHAAYWHANLQRNLVGPALTVTLLEDRIRPGGAVVSIGSIGAEYAGNPYSVAKAALAAWNAGLSARLGPRGVTANVVAAGFVDGTGLFGGRMSEDRRTSLIARTHTGRAGTPADVAATVRFLASPAARHLTGQCLHVNGGAFTTR